MSVNSIVYSQITGITFEQKKEIVTTLIDYPLLQKQLTAQVGLTTTYQEENISLWNVLALKEKEIKSLEGLVKKIEKQLEISNQRIEVAESKKSNGWIYGVVGTAVGVIAGVLIVSSN